MLRIIPLIVAIPLVAAYGLLEGSLTNRWAPSQELEKAIGRLKNVPLTVGAWQGTEKALDAQILQIFGKAGGVERIYVNPQRPGEEIQVLILCGAPGPVSVHTPEVCYGGAGFAMAEQAVRHSEPVPGLAEPAEFWTAEFRKTHPFPQQLRIYWGWSTRGEWVSPSQPRWNFAGQTALYKVYVIRPLAQTGSATRDEACMEFMAEFLPQLNQTFFPAPKNQN